MALSLNTNLPALQAHRQLSQSSERLRTSFDRLSSGLRITRASDDAAGLAISTFLDTDTRIFSQAVRNLSDGVSMLNIAEGSLNELSNIAVRLQELASQSSNGTLTNAQRRALDGEAQALTKEYFRISRETNFNGLRVFDGSLQTMQLQAGFGPGGIIDSIVGGALGTGTAAAATTVNLGGFCLNAIALGDVNRDGILDRVTGGGLVGPGGFVNVSLGSGGGAFAAPISYAAEDTNTQAVVLEDVNGDGNLDLISGGYASAGMATVRLGTGDGSFGSATRYAADSAILSVALDDLNGDGVPDLVTAGGSAGNGSVTVRLGRRDGTFGNATSYSSDAYSSSNVALVDLNRDGILDLATSGYATVNTGSATVRFGRGDGTFGSLSVYGQTGPAVGFAVGDLNNDGLTDLLSIGSVGPTPYLTTRLGQGDGSFGAANTTSLFGMSYRSVALGDLNGDGTLDLIAGGAGSGADTYALVGLSLGRGDGSFSQAQTYQMLPGASAIAVANIRAVATGDLDGDGVLDIVASGYGRIGGFYQGAVQVMLGTTRQGVSPLLPFSLATKADALQAIPLLSSVSRRLSAQRGVIGALQSRLATATSTLQTSGENYSAARSRITDADVAGESAAVIRGRILQQAGAAVLGQANQQPTLALRLLRGS